MSSTLRFAARAALPLVLLAVALPARAQEAGIRIGAGAAWADRPGAAALVAFELDRGPALLRAEARGVATGRSADWENSARVILAGGALGVRRDDGTATPWALLSFAGGLDAREGDSLLAAGAAAGLDGLRGSGLFLELRYERWFQRGVRHHELPGHAVTLLVGLGIR